MIRTSFAALGLIDEDATPLLEHLARDGRLRHHGHASRAPGCVSRGSRASKDAIAKLFLEFSLVDERITDAPFGGVERIL